MGFVYLRVSSQTKVHTTISPMRHSRNITKRRPNPGVYAGIWSSGFGSGTVSV
jgi:hypothetical protein